MLILLEAGCSKGRSPETAGTSANTTSAREFGKGTQPGRAHSSTIGGFSADPSDRGRVTSFEHRLAEVVYLEEKGPVPTAFEVSLGMIKATESLGFEHEFNPDERIPEPAF